MTASSNQRANPNYGKAIDRYSFDAWGEARDPSQWTPRTCSDNPQPPFIRGFTGQEHLPNSVRLMNFNARLYDPAIGRFFSADPTVEAPYDPQDLNRYTYVLNDPLNFTDPTGLCFLGCFWRQSWFAPALDIALVFVGLPWLDVATGIIGSASVGSGLFAAFGAENFSLMVANAGIAGGVSGYAATGKIGGALISAGSAAAFAGIVPGWGNEIGSALGGGNVATYAGDMVAGGMVGGLFSVANRQTFASGFLSGGVGSLAGPIGGNGPSIQSALVTSVLGGFSAVLGGGKFANGALTGAFAYAAQAAAQGGEDVHAGAASTPPETGDDAQVIGALFPGIAACGDSLCGAVPYDCEGASAQCSAVIDQLQNFSTEESFHLTFTPASSWQVFWNHFFNVALDIEFSGTQFDINGGEILGDWDPGGVPGALRYDVSGSWNGNPGTWELVIDESNVIYHFNWPTH